MTPVTRGIAAAEKNRHIPLSRLCKSGGTPGVPMDGVIRMAPQIGRRGLVESVFHGGNSPKNVLSSFAAEQTKDTKPSPGIFCLYLILIHNA